MAVGLTLVYGLLRILHMAHAGVFALGAYVMVLTVANATGSIALGLLAAVHGHAGSSGVAIYRLAYQPLLQYRPDVPMIASIGLLVADAGGVSHRVRRAGHGLRPGIFRVTSFNLTGINRQRGVEIAMIVVTAAVVFTELRLLRRDPAPGSAGAPPSPSPQMAASFGIDPIKVRYLNFAVRARHWRRYCRRAGGGAPEQLWSIPAMGFAVSYKALAIIVLGGLGSVRGTLDCEPDAGARRGLRRGVSSPSLALIATRSASSS